MLRDILPRNLVLPSKLHVDVSNQSVVNHRERSEPRRTHGPAVIEGADEDDVALVALPADDPAVEAGAAGGVGQALKVDKVFGIRGERPEKCLRIFKGGKLS